MTSNTTHEPSPDSTAVEFALLDTATGRRIDSPTLSGLVDALIPGHSDASDEQRLELRLEVLANTAAITQAAAIGDVELDAYDEDVLTVLMHDRLTTVPVFSEWEGETPLYLLATSYEPFSTTPAPVGDSIVWLDPSSERTFIEALVACGAVELYSREAL